MKRKFTASVWQEGDLHIAQCLELDVASQGKSKDDALKNLTEAIALHLDTPTAVLIPDLESIEVEIGVA